MIFGNRGSKLGRLESQRKTVHKTKTATQKAFLVTTDCSHLDTKFKSELIGMNQIFFSLRRTEIITPEIYDGLYLPAVTTEC